MERGVPPPPAWRALFLSFADGVTSEGAKASLSPIMAMLADLRKGVMRDLTSTQAGESSGLIPKATFAVLVGFGAPFFDHERHNPALTTAERPKHLVRLRPSGAAFPAIEWADDDPGERATVCRGEADLLLQFTGVSDHAVGRAAVEVANIIHDLDLPLETVGTYDGFQRDDGRSWIGFHDGVSNLEPSERRDGIECRGDPDWNRGGTYLAFLRLEIALGPWRALSKAEQEVIVGRDKLTGWPLESVGQEDGQLRPEPLARRPVEEISEWQLRDAYYNPPETASPLIEASHTHRVNQNKAAATTPSAHRIFRQGYEYLEEIGPDGPRLGLNFISFQNELYHLQQILGLRGWLGDVNFGGPTTPGSGEPEPIRLTSLRAGGFYVVPPREDPFPGARLFS